LFGIKLFDNATKYVSSEYIESNKNKYRETISGFYTLYMGDRVSSVYFDKIFIHIDDFNIIHTIYGKRIYPSEDRCITFLKELVSKLETKQQIQLDYVELDYGTFSLKRYHKWVSNMSINIQCNYRYDPIEHSMLRFIRSEDIVDAIEEFYEQD